MAGEWIKVRTNLWDDPRIGQLCEITDQSEAAVIGGLYWLWATADEHSSDGMLLGMTTRTIDRKTGVPGLGGALVTIGWLSENADGVTVSRFDEHNGASAKSRAQTAKRVATHKGNAKVTQPALPESESTVTDALPREEKIREEKTEATSKAEAASEPAEPQPEKPAKKPDATATRLPAGWIPSYDDARFCEAERPDLRIDEVADRFRDYWTAQPGTKGKKLDWSATWRNWVRNEKAQPRASPQPYQTANDKAKAWADRLTGKNRNDQHADSDIIDINPAPRKLG